MLQANENWVSNEILITNKGSDYILYGNPTNKDMWLFGKSSNGSIALSLEEAKMLVSSLQTSIQEFEDLDNSSWIVNSEPTNENIK
jgi:hypothetical protein